MLKNVTTGPDEIDMEEFETEGLRGSKEWLKIIYECSPDAIFVHDLKGRFIDGNQAAGRLVQREKNEMIGCNFLNIGLLPTSQIGKATAFLAKSGLGESTGPDEFSLKQKNGNIVIVEISSFPLKFKGRSLVFCVVREITSWRKAESELLAAKKKMQRYLDIAGVILVAIDRDGKTTLVNRKGCRVLGYSESELLGNNWFDICLPKSQREKVKTVFRRLISGEADPTEYHENAILTKDGEERIIAWHNTVIYDDFGRLTGTLSSGEDITDRKKMGDELIQNAASLKLSVESLINIVASTVEVRDPYTSGHQKKVAEIAVKLAEEMALPANQVDGIRAAGMIHDIGKISIPAEILSKPSRLSDIERSLMETHVQTGFDILKGIAFPWPVADIVRQHHERINGSGYPQGLKKKDILLEAKIIAVADVLEAMSSHRPYRPALGMQVALDEIQRNRGILFDAEVVDILMTITKNGELSLDHGEDNPGIPFI